MFPSPAESHNAQHSSPERGAFSGCGVPLCGHQGGRALLVFAILYALYSHEVKVESQVQELLAGPRVAGGQRAGGARADLNKDTPAGWLAAEASLKQALDLQPSNPYGVAAFADTETMLVGAGFADCVASADAAVARAEAKDVTQPERYAAAALRMVQSGKPADAETLLLAVLAKYGSVPRVLDALGVAQRAEGKLVESRMSFKRAQDADWRSARKVANYATALLEDGNAADALGAYDCALQANSEHLRSMLGKARAFAALARQGKNTDLKTALSLCDQVVSRGSDEVPPPLRAQALAARAEVKLAMGDAAGAAKDAAEAKTAAPDAVETLRALALTSKSGAFALWQAAVAKDKFDASLYFDGAESLAANGDAASAEKLLALFAAQLPKTARYDSAIAHLWWRAGTPRTPTWRSRTRSRSSRPTR